MSNLPFLIYFILLISLKNKNIHAYIHTWVYTYTYAHIHSHVTCTMSTLICDHMYLLTNPLTHTETILNPTHALLPTYSHTGTYVHTCTYTHVHTHTRAHSKCMSTHIYSQSWEFSMPVCIGLLFHWSTSWPLIPWFHNSTKEAISLCDFFILIHMYY